MSSALFSRCVHEPCSTISASVQRMRLVGFFPDSFSADTKLVLVNAIYFKSPWKYPFEPERTRKAPFYMRPGEKTIVDMMVIEDKFPYGNLAALNAKIVSIPYKVRPFFLYFGQAQFIAVLKLDFMCRATVSACKLSFRKAGNNKQLKTCSWL